MDDLNKLKVADLKAELKKRGLAVSGVKSVLIERLQEAIGKVAESTENTAAQETAKDVEQTVASAKTIDEPVAADKVDDEIAPTVDVMSREMEEVEATEDASFETPPVAPADESIALKSPEPTYAEQPPITDFIPTQTTETTIPIATNSPRTKSPAIEPGQKTIEETMPNQPVDNDTRKRKREQPLPIADQSLSSAKRVKPSASRRSRTPEPSPHRAVVATQSPSIHPPTKAIYITCLSRPLNLSAFKSHIVSLTTTKRPAVQLWLDNIKSHGYVVFDNEQDATTVRDAMNGVSWPPNEKRRNLSVDYIPVDKVQEWIDNEESSRGQRFEIVYVKQDDQIIVEQRIMESKESHPLRLIGDSAASVKSPERGIPTGPRAARREEIPKDRFEVRGGEKVRVVGPDELFKKTTSKPWIYWAEVSTEVRERRAKK